MYASRKLVSRWTALKKYNNGRSWISFELPVYPTDKTNGKSIKMQYIMMLREQKRIKE